MKYAIASGILIVGLTIGFFIGQAVSNDEVVETTDDGNPVEFITEYIRDTVVHKERIEVPIFNDTLALLDSLLDSTLLVLDSTYIDDYNDSIEDASELNIHREKKISQISLPIIYLSQTIDNDTVIKDMLGITETRVKSIVVEFWESPLNFAGYKLSRHKLVVYGLSPQHDYNMYRKKDDYFLSAQEVFYAMRETQEFLNYKEVSKDVVFND